MNLERLYDHTEKMLNDDELSVQEKRSMLYDWRRKTEAEIGKTILSATEIKQASEFLAHLSLRQSALANSKRCHGESRLTAPICSPLTLNFHGDPSQPHEICQEDYQKLKSAGLLWEFYPDAPDTFLANDQIQPANQKENES